MSSTIITQVSNKIRNISKNKIIQAKVVIEFGVGIRLEVATSTRVTKANGFEVDTCSAYRQHPITDYNRIVKEDKTDVYTKELVESYIKLMNDSFDGFLAEAKDHFMTLDAV